MVHGAILMPSTGFSRPGSSDIDARHRHGWHKNKCGLENWQEGHVTFLLNWPL